MSDSIQFNATNGFVPATNPATLLINNGTNDIPKAQLTFPTNEDRGAVFGPYTAVDYVSGDATIDTWWRSVDSENTGDIRIGVSIAVDTGIDLDALNWDTETIAVVTIDSTTGEVTLVSIDIPEANLQALTSGGGFWIRLRRAAGASDTGGDDDMAGRAGFVRAHFYH